MSSNSSAIGGVVNGCPITVSELASSRKLSPDLLRDLGWRDLPGGGIAIPYWGMQQEGLFSRARDVPGKGRRFDQPAGVSLQPYGLWRLEAAREQKCLYLCEGETDTVTLWQAGLAALGIPGANAAGCLEAAHLEGITSLLVLPDNPVREGDHSGEAFLRSMGPVLKQIDFQGKLWHVRVPAAHKDVNAWYARDPERFPAELESAVERAEQVEFYLPNRMKDHERNGQAKHVPASLAIKSSVGPYLPFPLKTLPSVLRMITEEAAAALNCDPSYIALPGITALAVAIGRSRDVRLKRKWCEPAVVWGVVIGESGTLKTPAWRLILEALHKIQNEWRKEDNAELEKYNEDMADWEDDRKQAIKQSLPIPTKPEKPQRRRFLVSDITVERLAEILEDWPRGLLVSRDELAGWLGSFTRYKGKAGGTDLPNWLELHQAGVLSYDRKSGDRRTIYVPGAVASVCGGIQPGTLAHLIKGEHIEAGLPARCLFTHPDRLPKVWTEADISLEAEQKWENLLRLLLSLKPTIQEGQLIPIALSLDPEARKVWIEFYNEWAIDQANAEGEMASARAKLEAYAIRFALIHSLAEQATLTTGDCKAPIDVASMKAGIELVRWFMHEAERVYALLGETLAERSMRNLVAWVQRFQARTGRWPQVRDYHKGHSRQLSGHEEAESALQQLVDLKLAQWKEEIPAHGGHQARFLILLEQAADKQTLDPEGEPVVADTRPDAPSEEPLHD